VAVTESPTGWYQDDDDPTLARWWDGERWTEHTIALGDDMAGPSEPLGWSASDFEIDAPDAYQHMAAEDLFPDMDETLLAPVPPSRSRFPRPIEGLPVPGVEGADVAEGAPAADEDAGALDPTAAFFGLGAIGALGDDEDLPFGPDATGVSPAHRRRDDGFGEPAGRWPLSSGVGAAVVAVLVVAAAAIGSYVVFHDSSDGKKDASTTSSSSTTQVTFLPLSPGITDTTAVTSTTVQSTSTSTNGATTTTVRRTTTTTRPATTTTAPATTTTTAPTTTTTAATTTTTESGTTGGPSG
jgi:cell division septation protein DedD